MTDSRMNFQNKAPKIPPRILCIGMPVRDLTFRVQAFPGAAPRRTPPHFDEICGGNALNAAIGIVRLGGRASICGPMGDAGETSSRFIFDKMAHEGIETKHLVHMPGLVTPISAVMIDPTRRAHHRDVPRSGTVEGAIARHRHAAGRLRRHPDREPLRGILHGSLRRGAAGAASPSSSTSIARCRCARGCSRRHRIWCSRASRCRRPPTSPTTPRR